MEEVFGFLLEKGIGAGFAFVLICVFEFPKNFREVVERIIFVSFIALSFTQTMLIILDKEVTPALVTTCAVMAATIAYTVLRIGQEACNYSLEQLFSFVVKPKKTIFTEEKDEESGRKGQEKDKENDRWMH